MKDGGRSLKKIENYKLTELSKGELMKHFTQNQILELNKIVKSEMM